METVSSLLSSVLPPQPFPAKHPHRKIRINQPQSRPRSRVSAGQMDAYNRDYDGELVDENMIVLRRRIHAMKMSERKYEPPSNWTEWEKKYYENYNSDICEAMGLLQTLLMNTRPSLALGMMALVAFNVSLSTAATLSHLIQIAKWVLSLVHLN